MEMERRDEMKKWKEDVHLTFQWWRDPNLSVLSIQEI